MVISPATSNSYNSNTNCSDVKIRYSFKAREQKLGYLNVFQGSRLCWAENKSKTNIAFNQTSSQGRVTKAYKKLKYRKKALGINQERLVVCLTFTALWPNLVFIQFVKVFLISVYLEQNVR